MTVKQIASYLNVNERTILKLVSDGVLPGVKVGNQWRFRKAMIDTWLDDQMLGVIPSQLDILELNISPRQMLELANCFQPENIIPELVAKTKIAVVEELAAHAHRLGLIIDKTWFIGALIERENILPSAMGNGIAFLHTLRRHPTKISRPFMILGRSQNGIDFDSLDGQPTHLFFVLGLKFEELHLPWLHKLTQMFAQGEAIKNLLAAPDADAIYKTLCKAEHDLRPEPMVEVHKE